MHCYLWHYSVKERQEKVPPGTNTLWNRETKLCASTLSWSLKIASTGGEAPCRCSEPRLSFYTCVNARCFDELHHGLKAPQRCLRLPHVKQRNVALSSYRPRCTTMTWWPAEGASGLCLQRLDHFKNQERCFWHPTAPPTSFTTKRLLGHQLAGWKPAPTLWCSGSAIFWRIVS